MIGTRSVLLLLLLAPHALAGQQPDPVEQMRTRGLPESLVAEVAQVTADATAQGLPADPLVEKAIEGWAKRVPADRIMAAIQQFRIRLQEARQALSGAGHAEPLGPVVAAAAEAMARGLGQEQVGVVVDAAPTPDAAGRGLKVAAALTAQGIGTDQAVGIVVRAMRRGQADADLLDLPSVANAMRAQGMAPGQIGQRLMQGAGSAGGAGIGPGQGSRPQGVPPGGPPELPPGQKKKQP
ncbi:MAG: hypothetical protein AMS20_07655 [Gemmatimonas sp. SG8_28]|jgi:hypothetical protein|nr:MAG: hypothetical protein AMS20_07655 [Gemmatimonas sp. SG8_28]